MPFERKLRIAISATALFFLSGCPKELTLAEACKDLNGFCDKIKVDSGCRPERQTVLMMAHRLETAPTPSAKDQYQQLLNLEVLKACAYKQTLVEYIPGRMKFRTADKLPNGKFTPEALVKIQAHDADVQKRMQIKRKNLDNTELYLDVLAKETVRSKDPHLLYWHWSRQQDRNAIKQLVGLHDTGKITDYDILYYLALEFGVYEPKRAENLLLESLTRYPEDRYTRKELLTTKPQKYAPADDDGRLHYPAMRHLVQIYFDRGSYEASYVFAQILHFNNDRSANVDMLVGYLKKHLPKSSLKSLDDIAEDIDDDLSDGEFLPSNYPILRQG